MPPMRMKSLLNFIIIASVVVVWLVLPSCKPQVTTQSSEKPVARVFDSYLYPSDLQNIVPKDIPPKDSAQLIKNYIDKWVQDELVLKHAEQNLSTEQLNVEKQLAETRKNLLIYNYHTELIAQKLDTIITDADIEKYYNENKVSFTLKDNIVKVWYVKVNKDAPGCEKIQRLYKSTEEKDFATLKSLCLQFADNFFLDENNWLLFDELLKEIPVTSLNPELFLKTNRYIEVADSSYNYYVNIKAFEIKNSVSPLAFERENIRNIIINKRKLSLIEDMKREVYEKAKNKGNFEVYK